MQLNFLHLKTFFWEGVHRLHQTAEAHKRGEGSWVWKLASPCRCARRPRTLLQAQLGPAQPRRQDLPGAGPAACVRTWDEPGWPGRPVGALASGGGSSFCSKRGLGPRWELLLPTICTKHCPSLLIRSQNGSFHWLPSLKHAERRGRRLLCRRPCESQHRAPVRRGAGGPLVRRSPEECAAWELLLEDPCLSPRS